MTAIVVDKFSGIAPKIDRKQLADNMAVVANNCYLDRLNLDGFPTANSTAFTGGSTWQSLYMYRDTTFIGSSNQLEYAEAPVPNDAWARIVITDRTTYPKVYTLGTTYRLGLPAPVSAPVATPSEAPANPDAVDAETVSYVVTYVDAFGNEGPPSPPSASIERVRDTNVALYSMPTAPAGNYNFGAGSKLRIYRSNSGTDSTNYQYVKEVSLGTSSTTDNIKGADLQELLPSATWTAAPDDDTTRWSEPMRGVVSMQNGMLAGFTDKTVVFNEPYLLHAWPTNYSITFAEKIVSIVNIAAGLLVLTSTRPYLVSGVHPSSLAVQPIELMQGCVSERSVVDMGDYAMYASQDGIVAIYGAEAELATRDLLTRVQWNVGYKPSSIRAYNWEGKYVAFYDNDTTEGAIIFDPREGTKAFVTMDEHYDAAVNNAKNDQLYVMNNGSTAIKEFGRNFVTKHTYEWKSKRFVTPKPVSFSTIRVEVEDGDYSDITIEVWGDGVLRDTIDCSGFTRHTPYTRLTAGHRCKVWSIEVTGTSVVTYIGLFESIAEAI